MTATEILGTAEQPVSSRRRPVEVMVVLLVLVATLATVVLIRSRGSETAPYAFADLHASGRTRLVPVAEAQGVVDGLVTKGLLRVPVDAEGSVVVGQVTYALPAQATGQLALLVTDTVNGTSTTSVVGNGPTADDGAGRFWDGRLSAVAADHSWLRGIADRGDGSGTFTKDPMALSLPRRRPLTFVAQLPPGGAPENGVTLTLVLQDEGGAVRWVERLPA